MVEVRTIPALAKESGVSEFTLRKLCRDGKLPYLEIGNRWLIRVQDFQNLFTTKKSECASDMTVATHSDNHNGQRDYTMGNSHGSHSSSSAKVQYEG